jgi:hypothetical protein
MAMIVSLGFSSNMCVCVLTSINQGWKHFPGVSWSMMGWVECELRRNIEQDRNNAMSSLWNANDREFRAGATEQCARALR